MRAIDADALIERLKAWDTNDATDKALYSFALNRVLEAPTVEPQRKTGKWIKKMHVTETEKYTSYDPDWYCACCGAKYDPHIARMVNFCYVCGADMRDEQDETSNRHIRI